jgi:CRISPR system Cascade subunit CasC
MFGRMLADNPDFNREAAVQVAHAITTHRVDVEDDFYTAVDDLKSKAEDAGAGFIGEFAFGAGVFYNYACVDRDLLEKNLEGDRKGLANTAISALIEGLATASPTGKQASFASRARASYLRIEKGSQQPRSLAAAFLKPIRGDDLLADSIAELEKLGDAMNKAYGPCFDNAPATMNVQKGQGSLERAVAFAVAE